MNKLFVKIYGFILAIITIFSFPITTFAYEYGNINIDSMVKETKIGEKRITSISPICVNQIRNSRMCNRKGGDAIFVEMLQCLGITLEEAQYQNVLESVSLSDIGSISTATVYLEFDEQGNEKIVSEEKAMNAHAQNTVNPRVASVSNSSVPETSSNGYMRQQITIIYTPNYHGANTTVGRYVFLGSCEWLVMPVFRKTDCICISGTDIRWNNKYADGISNYSLIVSYDVTDYMSNGTSLTHSELETYEDDVATVGSYQGVFFDYNLPNNSSNAQESVTFSNLTFVIMAIGRVHNYSNANQQLGVDLSYIHIQFSLQTDITFDWLSDSHIVVCTTARTTEKEYKHSYSWDYARDYYA